MELTNAQKDGLRIAVERYRNREKYTVISGYAGTGKSTLVKFIIKELKVDPEKVVYCAYTGKACTVLQKKGNQNVSTLHKLLYSFQLLPDGSFIKTPKKDLEYSLIIVDECSMVDVKMIELLLSHPHIHVIFLGDPFQIPPVQGGDNGLLKAPHVFLTEIMRQALDNEIIKFSMDVRLGKPLPKHYKGNNVQIYSADELTGGMLLWADQVLCSTNATRLELNSIIRELKGYEGEPKVGEKVICLHNNWDLYDSKDNALVNGTIGYLTKIDKRTDSFHPYLHLPDNKLPYYMTDLRVDGGGEFSSLKMDAALFEGQKPYLDITQAARLKNYKKGRKKYQLPESFTYGYAITCHKAQGSSWPKVLVIEENSPFSTIEHRRWLYTAITRAEDKLVIITK